MKKQLLTLAISVCFANMAQASEWGYEGERGPEHWGHVSKICETGKNQSPIDINDFVEADLKSLDIHYSGVVGALTNNGHTLQASVSGKNTLVVDGTEFELKQFHFHTPSENLIKGHQYPLEAHFVHADVAGNLAVLAVMFETGTQNEPLAQLTAELPKVGASVQLAKGLAVQSLLPKLDEYYRFNGSLTTPPCSEGVRWLVVKQPKSLSQQQSVALHSVMGNNNRPIQAHNARLVLEKE
ncbi:MULTISPECIES: carbonic anhydrase [unclassified Vibrio]|uniref:carbonic anhydrase n=1 Tax=unclassified Vibrio TaxID=2614977 RepID=UPI000B8E98D0|nr:MULTISPECIES: carbonic anhydrase [unclassified Vibrio]NAW98080.1 carbonic anhydrase [Vibrio sp. V23_P3S9T160]OXX45090.1 carbonic anhydrase [Vibrio sp. V11_P1A41T118]